MTFQARPPTLGRRHPGLRSRTSSVPTIGTTFEYNFRFFLGEGHSTGPCMQETSNTCRSIWEFPKIGDPNIVP